MTALMETRPRQEARVSNAPQALFALGSRVRCDDESVGVLADLILDPIERRLTHVVVEPRRHHELGHLVPADLLEVSPEDSNMLSLRCPATDLNRFPPIQVIRCLTRDEPLGGEPDWDIGIEHAIAQPGLGDLYTDLEFDQHLFVVYDRIPRNTVELDAEALCVAPMDGESGTSEG